MSRTTDDILTVAQRAIGIGRQFLPTYSNPFSPRKFTQPQLFAEGGIGGEEKMSGTEKRTEKRDRSNTQ